LTAIAQARLVLGVPSQRVQAQLAVDELRILVALDPDHADVLIPGLPDEPTSRLLLARLAVVRRDWVTATQILEGVGPVTVRDQVEWGTLCSLVYRQRDLRRAHRHLADVVTLAKPHRYLTTIIGGGAGMVDLLRSTPAAAPIKDYVDTLVRAADATAPAAAGPEVMAAGGSMLTSREIDVLRLLSSRLTSHEIAQTLFISINTLKSHMKSIYVKLGVSSRAQAVRVASARGLLHAGAS
jgi:LuxR family maltose regulon positive regulatory protein